MEWFLTFRIFGSLVDLAPALTAQVDLAWRAVLITAIAALGVKTSLKALMAVGDGHLAIVVVETPVLLTVPTAALAELGVI